VNPVRANIIADADAEYHRPRTIDRGPTHKRWRRTRTRTRVRCVQIWHPEPTDDVREGIGGIPGARPRNPTSDIWPDSRRERYKISVMDQCRVCGHLYWLAESCPR
jgi:hypothetical protein